MEHLATFVNDGNKTEKIIGLFVFSSVGLVLALVLSYYFITHVLM